MGDTEPAEVCKRKESLAAPIAAIAATPAGMAVICFDRNELREIFSLYGRKVAGGEWRDYGIDFTSKKRFFRFTGARANMRSTGSRRLRGWRESKAPSHGDRPLKRGPDLRFVIAALDTRLKLVSQGTGGDASFA
jgi:hypothetical protein